MTNINQQLSIQASQEFRKGNIDKAWKMALQSNTLVENVTKEKWIAFQKKVQEERKLEESQRNAINFSMTQFG